MSDETAGRARIDVGETFPAVQLPATTGGILDPVADSAGDFVLFVYPRTGRTDRPEDDDWALIPGAKGCTAESSEFRDLAADFARIGLRIYGLSTQDTDDQREAAERLHLPYPLLSDQELTLRDLLGVPTFRYDGVELYRRSTVVVRAGVVVWAEWGILDAESHPRALLADLAGQAPGTS
ncbi:peroxiredoxin [Cnuibacter sp. UC19_7]|uniref:peroxiredoxin n=1 Tax=Cnuibacter sp. UC19_7 TaxID=3350166 RepID=UPI00366D0C8E